MEMNYIVRLCNMDRDRKRAMMTCKTLTKHRNLEISNQHRTTRGVDSYTVHYLKECFIVVWLSFTKDHRRDRTEIPHNTCMVPEKSILPKLHVPQEEEEEIWI